MRKEGKLVEEIEVQNKRQNLETWLEARAHHLSNQKG